MKEYILLAKGAFFMAEHDYTNERITGTTVEENDSSKLRLVRSNIAEHIRTRHGLPIQEIINDGDIIEPARYAPNGEVVLKEPGVSKVVDISTGLDHQESRFGHGLVQERTTKKAA